MRIFFHLFRWLIHVLKSLLLILYIYPHYVFFYSKAHWRLGAPVWSSFHLSAVVTSIGTVHWPTIKVRGRGLTVQMVSSNPRVANTLHVEQYTDWLQKSKCAVWKIPAYFAWITLTSLRPNVVLHKMALTSNGFNSTSLFFITHVIQTFCWQWLSGMELKIFSKVQRRKYDTIDNVCQWV